MVDCKEYYIEYAYHVFFLNSPLIFALLGAARNTIFAYFSRWHYGTLSLSFSPDTPKVSPAKNAGGFTHTEISPRLPDPTLRTVW